MGSSFVLLLPQSPTATPAEALNSSLMGFFEKRKFRNFLIFLSNYDKTKPATYHKGKTLDQMTTRQLYEDFGLDANTQAFTGHAMALHRDDDYLDQPAEATAEAIQLYVYSLERYGKSPYIYPMYGLGGMPEGFSRLCAIHGGTFMLNKGVDEVLFENGKAWGIKTGNEVRICVNAWRMFLFSIGCSFYDDIMTAFSISLFLHECVSHMYHITKNFMERRWPRRRSLWAILLTSRPARPAWWARWCDPSAS